MAKDPIMKSIPDVNWGYGVSNYSSSTGGSGGSNGGGGGCCCCCCCCCSGGASDVVESLKNKK